MSSPTSLATREFERILLIKPSSLGDVVHALPVLHGLRARYPKARIDWLVGHAFAPLLAGQPEVDELVVFDRREARSPVGRPRAWGYLAKFRRRLRAAKYDLALDLQGLFRSGWFAAATRAPVRLGLGSAREGAGLFYSHRVDVPTMEMHAVDRYYLVAAELGFADTPIRFGLKLPDPVRATADRMLAEVGVSPEQPFIAMVPGARWETKRWPIEHFARLIEALGAELPLPIVLFGSKSERDLCASLTEPGRYACEPATRKNAPSGDLGASRMARVVDLVGATTVPEMAALLGRAAVVVCHDSAAAHLAAALERPLVCLTGPTNPQRTGPYGRLDDVLQLELDCAPCYLKKLRRCPYNHRCLRELSVDQVRRAVLARVADSGFSDTAIRTLADDRRNNQ
jgi:heptosyltransferase-1